MRSTDFDIACDFYKTHLNKAFTLTYDQKLTLSALFNQAKHGPYSPEKAPDVGLLDFIGKERRAKWRALGSMSEIEAQDTFVHVLLQICPHFAAHLEANDILPCQNSMDFQPEEPNDLPPTAVHGINSYSATTKASATLKGYHLSHAQEAQIRNALNAQTLHQFQAYAAQYYPDNETMQAQLITQLQDRHFHQYMIYIQENSSVQNSSLVEKNPQVQDREEMLLASQLGNQSQEVASRESPKDETKPAFASGKSQQQQSNGGDIVAHIPDGKNHFVAPQMWTRNDIVEFKELLSKETESIINVGSGELVTIRVPIVSTGNTLVWEFATDDYDIGFGLCFEWPRSKAATKTADGSEQADPNIKSPKAPWNIILGSSQPLEDSGIPADTVVEELIPIYRRTSHVEVYCGSHVYPSTIGTYLLKFDNTYSLWRNKVLYYRVYCTQ